MTHLLCSTDAFVYYVCAALLEWAEELGRAICHTHGLPEPLPLSQPSLEPAVYVGRVVCDGEGHLNSSSVLLEGALQPGTLLSHRVRLEIPGSSGPYSLFPGQVSYLYLFLISCFLSHIPCSFLRLWLWKESTLSVGLWSQLPSMTR